MRKLNLAILVVCCVSISTQQYPGIQVPPSVETTSCNVNRDVSIEYRSALYEFGILLYKSVAVQSNFNFIFSPISVWIILAAIAEGSEPLTQQKLFRILNLPGDPCTRQAYYQLATTRAVTTNYVNIRSTRVMLINDGSTLNPSWYDFVVRNALLDVVTAQIRYNPVATANEIKRIMSARLPRLDLTGNSVLLDTMDYNGLWTTAFADATVERAPFYDLAGQTIGAVDLMRVKRRARMGYLKKLNSKIIELPVGVGGRYRMLFCVPIGKVDLGPLLAAVNKDLVFVLLETLRESYVQLDVAIPRMMITSEIDMRTILEDLEVTELWTKPAVTSGISEPAALPSSFVQRSTLVLNNTGLASPPPVEEDAPSVTRTGLEPILGRDFTADRPILFALFDAETYSPLITAAFTSPTYPL